MRVVARAGLLGTACTGPRCLGQRWIRPPPPSEPGAHRPGICLSLAREGVEWRQRRGEAASGEGASLGGGRGGRMDGEGKGDAQKEIVDGIE